MTGSHIFKGSQQLKGPLVLKMSHGKTSMETRGTSWEAPALNQVEMLGAWAKAEAEGLGRNV